MPPEGAVPRSVPFRSPLVVSTVAEASPPDLVSDPPAPRPYTSESSLPRDPGRLSSIAEESARDSSETEDYGDHSSGPEQRDHNSSGGKEHDHNGSDAKDPVHNGSDAKESVHDGSETEDSDDDRDFTRVGRYFPGIDHFAINWDYATMTMPTRYLKHLADVGMTETLKFPVKSAKRKILEMEIKVTDITDIVNVTASTDSTEGRLVRCRAWEYMDWEDQREYGEMVDATWADPGMEDTFDEDDLEDEDVLCMKNLKRRGRRE